MKRLITLHSENLFFLFLFALLIIGFLCSSVTAENGPSPLVTPGSVSGLGTMAVVDSPVPVANGGTGKTTAAEALAALGGASLNGSSTVNFVTKNFATTGFATLGELGTGFKMKILATNTASVEGGQIAIPHNLTSSKIIAVTAQVKYDTVNSNWVPPECQYSIELQFSFLVTASSVIIQNHATNSGSILSKPVVISIWYTE